MNLYFLVEGVTERKLYPKWLTCLLPGYRRVDIPSDAKENNYYLISGGGFPHLLDVQLADAIEDVKDAGNYDYFVMILDADEVTVEERLGEVQGRLETIDTEIPHCKIKIIIQNRCIESWLLGNRKIFHRQPEAISLRECVQFFDVYENDPEQMYKPDGYNGSVGDYHHDYLKLMLAARNIHYSKRYPRDVVHPYYLAELQRRVTERPEHLRTFQNLIQFCQELG